MLFELSFTTTVVNKIMFSNCKIKREECYIFFTMNREEKRRRMINERIFFLLYLKFKRLISISYKVAINLFY